MPEPSANAVIAYDVIERIAGVKVNRPDERNSMSPMPEMMAVFDCFGFRGDAGILMSSGTAWSAAPEPKNFEKRLRVSGG